MITKIKNFFKTNSLFSDLSEFDINASKLDWYNSLSINDEDYVNVTYFVQYQGYSQTLSWGPFKTFESASEWVDHLNDSYKLSCNIVSALDPKSNPKDWPL